MSGRGWYKKRYRMFDYYPWLQAALHVSNVSCVDLCKHLGYTPSNQSLFLNGGFRLTYNQIVSICDYLHAPLDRWAESSSYVRSLLDEHNIAFGGDELSDNNE